jgi:hypothetical protein
VKLFVLIGIYGNSEGLAGNNSRLKFANIDPDSRGLCYGVF